MREKCETEIRHLRKLNHKNIVAFKGVCTGVGANGNGNGGHGGNGVGAVTSYCIVMEFCPYGQLCQFLKQCESLYPMLVIDWSRQIASGMAYLHKHMIIHRDLKSPNVLISHNNVLKISDFGTSRQLNDCHSTKMSFAGTVAWMAPEVIRNEPCSEKIDVWSFGVVLWELLTLEIPYRDFEQSTIIYGVGNSTLSLPLPDSFPQGYRLLMQLCWKTKPRNRPSFYNILAHIEIASREFHDIKPEEFYERQLIWKQEVRSSLSQARISFHSSNSALEMSVESNNRADDMLMMQQQLQMQQASTSRDHSGSSQLRRHEELAMAAAKQAQIEQYEAVMKNVASLYSNMITVMADMAERERKLCKAEKTVFRKSLAREEQMSSLLKKAVTDPAYKSLSSLQSLDQVINRQMLEMTATDDGAGTSSSMMAATTDDINLVSSKTFV